MQLAHIVIVVRCVDADEPCRPTNAIAMRSQRHPTVRGWRATRRRQSKEGVVLGPSRRRLHEACLPGPTSRSVRCTSRSATKVARRSHQDRSARFRVFSTRALCVKIVLSRERHIVLSRERNGEANESPDIATQATREDDEAIGEATVAPSGGSSAADCPDQPRQGSRGVSRRAAAIAGSDRVAGQAGRER
jgi:hypothetical protein